MGGIFARGGSFTQLRRHFHKIPDHARRAVVELAAIRGSGLAALDGSVRRARQEPTVYRGKIAGPILMVLSLTMAAFFIVGTTYFTKHLPASKEAPKVGARAPEFALADTNGKMVTLAALLSEPMPEREGARAKPRGVALIFYRGYW